MEEERNDDLAQESTPEVDSKVDDRPERNWKAEMDRKLGERDNVIENLQSSIEELKLTQSTQQAENHKDSIVDEISELGYDTDEAKKLVQLLDKSYAGKMEQLRKDLAKENEFIKSQVYSTSVDRHFQEIMTEDLTGFVSDNKEDIKKVIDGIAPGILKTKDDVNNAVNMVLGKIYRNKPSKKDSPDSPTQDSPSKKPAKKSKGTASEKRVSELVQEFDTDEDSARGVANAAKDLDKLMFKK